jgi:hypothetical protein
MKTMRVWVIALLVASCPPAGAEQNRGWDLQLESVGLERFDRGPVTRWIDQQGVVFLTAERLLVYQVSHTPEARLGPRDTSGGAGNFVLNIKVLSSQDGHLIKTVQQITNAAISQVLATSEGRFVIRSGNKITLYSPNFEPLASRQLRLQLKTEVEDWQVRVSPSGAHIVLLHEQVFSTPEILADGSVLHDGTAKVDVEILDSATLEPRKSFVLAHTMPFWAPADDFLVSSNPAHSYSDQQVGVLDFEGKWSPIRTDFKLPKSDCGYAANAVDRRLIVVHGCETFTVLSVQGEHVFSRNDGRFVFAAAKANGRYLALQCDQDRPGLSLSGHASGRNADVDQIQVYDVDRHKQVLSYHPHKTGIHYAISSRGDLAVADGARLSLARVEN